MLPCPICLLFAPKLFFGSIPVPSLMACCGNTMLDFASSIHASLNCALTFVNQLIPTLAVPKPAKPKSQHVACLELQSYIPYGPEKLPLETDPPLEFINIQHLKWLSTLEFINHRNFDIWQNRQSRQNLLIICFSKKGFVLAKRDKSLVEMPYFEKCPTNHSGIFFCETEKLKKR